jgi:Ca2+-binding EF-hand superfamily protein
LLEKKCQKKENFNKIFSKIDKDNSGTLNKKEFLRLTKLVIKGSDDGTAKNLLTDEMFDIIWADFCNKNDEVDCITASNWIFSD